MNYAQRSIAFIKMNEYFKNRNSYRMPAYHRLDVGFNFHKQKKHGLRTWSLGAYNAYNHLNPTYLTLPSGLSPMYKKSLTQYSYFPTIPYIKYSFDF